MVKFREIIRHQDELLSMKVNKQTHVDLDYKMQKQLEIIQQFEKYRASNEKDKQAKQEMIDSMKDSIEKISRDTKQNIVAAVKRVTSKLFVKPEP